MKKYPEVGDVWQWFKHVGTVVKVEDGWAYFVWESGLTEHKWYCRLIMDKGSSFKFINNKEYQVLEILREWKRNLRLWTEL